VNRARAQSPQPRVGKITELQRPPAFVRSLEERRGTRILVYAIGRFGSPEATISTTDPQRATALSGSPIGGKAGLKEVAQPATAREGAAVGRLRAAPESSPVVASPDHPFLGQRGELT
jgi:hypothetical protein